MARSFDRKKHPAGPMTTDGRHVMRGNRRMLVGRVTPGDDIEVSREIERIWLWLNDARRKSKIALTTAQNVDLSAITGRLDDIEILVPGIGIPPTTIYSFSTAHDDLTGSFAFTDEPANIIPDCAYWYNLGYRLQFRLAGGASSGSPSGSDGQVTCSVGIGGVLSDHQTAMGYCTAGGGFDTGWHTQSMATSAAGVYTLTGNVQKATGGAGYPLSIIGTAYARWTGTGISLFSLGAGEISDTGYYLKTTATLTSTQGLVYADAGAAAFTITLPAAASNSGRSYRIKKIDSSANAVTIDGNASEKIDGATTQALGSQYECVEINCDGAAWNVVSWFAGTPL